MSPKSLTGSARLADRFAALRQAHRRAFIPFIMTGDPSIAITEALIPALVVAGADVIELGVPFSDPLADGPTIQRASARALANGVSLADVLRLVDRVHRHCPVPIVLLTYYNPICQMGAETFCQRAAAAGVSGVIVPDLPPEEGRELIGAARRHGVATVFLLAPTSTPERVRLVDRTATGFIYYVSVTGITGARKQLPQELVQNLHRVRAHVRWPLCVGFGVSTPEQARRIAAAADGVIVGSAIVERMERSRRSEIVPTVRRLVSLLAAATHSIRRHDDQT